MTEQSWVYVGRYTVGKQSQDTSCEGGYDRAVLGQGISDQGFWV